MDDVDPWEELDVDDDSELIAFTLRPCNRAASHSLESNTPRQPTRSPTAIPGPAGAVKAAMQRRTESHRHHGAHQEGQAVIPTQEFVRRVVENGDDEDADFAADPWLSALDFVTNQGGDFPTPLGSIRKGIETHRVALVFPLFLIIRVFL